MDSLSSTIARSNRGSDKSFFVRNNLIAELRWTIEPSEFRPPEITRIFSFIFDGVIIAILQREQPSQ